MASQVKEKAPNEGEGEGEGGRMLALAIGHRWVVGVG